MVAPAPPLSITDGQREVLETLLRSHTAPVRQVRRAEVLLLAADGVSNVEIAERCEVSRPTVLAWRRQFETEGLVRFGEVAKGRGARPSIPEETIAEVVRLTTQSTPEGATHWSVRAMAERVGISPASVQRIWSELGLKPHLVATFKVSTDPRFEQKLIDVVGLYLNPPDKAVVLCMDEKSQVQGLSGVGPGPSATTDGDVFNARSVASGIAICGSYAAARDRRQASGRAVPGAAGRVARWRGDLDGTRR